MNKAAAVFIFFCIFCACTPEDSKLPKNVLSIDTMKVVVWHLIEAGDYATNKKSKDSTIKLLNTTYFGAVLKLHHLDKTTFQSSFNFYQAHPNFNSILFDSVNAYAQRQRGEMFKRRQ